MIFSKKTHDGELFVDHRFSPGLSPEAAMKMGYYPNQVREGAQFRCATIGCLHCGTPVVLNHDRKRERAWCSICDVYICDCCDFIRSQPGYVHRTFAEIAELVRNGKFIVSGPASNPTLTPVEN
jgi:hypothetical protein